MYQKVVNQDSLGESVMIFRSTDSAWIPTDPANTDYAAYLAWIAEGNEPEVIDL